MSVAWRQGSTRAWRTLRAQILARDGHRCQIRLEGVCTEIATCVHHTKGKAHGDDPRHLQSACQPCNRRIGNPNQVTPGQRLVAYIRSQGHPVSRATLMHQFPDLHVNALISRGIARGEIIRVGRGTYAAGPTEPPTPTPTGDPAPEPRTRW